ncbi:MAG: GntR family transcriptional regulator [Pseudomonadales bacterium]|jgi:phosphoribosylformylglycinamidine cyclo-ligase|nr:GntR family transcriptional regulator [Pseudomonadales bacterium]MDP7360607.1 GntR family transcriptional regulator [Pseudomonadales bacterium]HJN51170.1 GntR family transcriptional regulator [Pseudomonadales bacterium]|tara:strand:- start:370 stop:1782 length:1413 start_codon:yes stop_codon:yes gene_type:complete
MMKLDLDDSSKTPVFQQIVDQIHFAINTGELKAGDKLPSIRALASENNLAANTVAKALRQLEFRSVLQARDRSGYVVADSDSNSRYQARGVSADKGEVHRVVDNLDEGIFGNAFCKITEDYLGGDPDRCNVIHADGSGTKSIIAYLHYKETGDASVFHGIAQDSIVMNLDDLLCIGVNGRIVISNTINRNALNCPGEVIAALIEGSERFLAELRQWGVNIHSGGGETADVGDLTGTVVVDSCAVSVMRKSDVITGDRIGTDLAIVGLASTGKGTYETASNSGIGSNGLTSARHDMLRHVYAERYPESFDANVAADLVYCGPYDLTDPLPDSDLTVGQALLSPTRTYAPVIHNLLAQDRDAIRGIVHCSGGAQTKCLKFGRGVHFVKNDLFPTPPVFRAIQAASGTESKEMYQVFNMGHRLEIYCEESSVNEVIDVAGSFHIEAQQIGHTEANSTAANRLTIVHDGTTIEY